MQIEAQARVNQDPPKSHLPATAWPRQMLAVVYVTQYLLPMGVGRGDHDPPSAVTQQLDSRSSTPPSAISPWELVAVTMTRPQRAQEDGGQEYGRIYA